jgi:predicted DNA-binding protein with PD1-like motif
MIVFESRLMRRFVGRLERGEEVIGTLQQLCEHERIRAGWIRGTGIFERAEVMDWDAEREAWKAPRRIDGPITVTSLEGNVAIRNGPPFVELRAALVRADKSTGGVLASARVYALDFAIEVYEDVRLERDEDHQTGLASFKGSSVRGVVARAREAPRPEPVAEPVPERPSRAATPSDPPRPSAPAVPASWAAAIAASQQAERAAPLEEPVPQKGDFLDHRQFGTCRVDGEDEDGGLRIRLPSGVRKTIKLDVLEVLPPRHEGDKKIFPVRPRSRR